MEITWLANTTNERQEIETCNPSNGISLNWLDNMVIPSKNGVQIIRYVENAIDTVLPSGQVAMRSQLVLFLDRGYLEISKKQNADNITNLIQLMMRLGVRFVGTVKNTASFPFIIHDHNIDKIRTSQNKVVLQSYGIRSHFSCYTKIGTTMKVSVLRNWIGKIRLARIATNLYLY